jgi:hypothetical protein
MAKIDLTGKRPHKILSLDGGGIRGIITLEILACMEEKLRIRLKADDDFTLSDYFDYFSGTSTGAIIATALSLGKKVSELMDFYDKFGEKMFDKAFLWGEFSHLYNEGPMLQKLKEMFGEDTDLDLDHGRFRSLLLVVAMNRSTDSPWPVTNNPFAKYNNKERADCNLRIKLFQLVRASSAAPLYFRPETIRWDPNDPTKDFTFVDGGVTPYNNPAFLAYRMCTLPQYNLHWEIGEDKLLIVSVGTGSAPSAGAYANFIKVAENLPVNMMYAMQVDQDINCRTVGRCTYGSEIDHELGTMIPDEPLTKDLGKHFLYTRYNVELSRKGLDAYGLKTINPDEVSQLDSVKFMDKLHLVGKAAATQVSLDHFGPFIPQG